MAPWPPTPALPPPFFGPSGRSRASFPATRSGPRSRRCPTRSDRALREGGVLLAEAGTGTGKTLAYLLPAVELGRRVVVSTGTKNLQEQLLDKDIPLLARALGRDLNVAVMKGRGNYLCLLRYRSFGAGGELPPPRRGPVLPGGGGVGARAPRPATAREVADLPDAVDFWREISAASENCIGQACPDFDPCWVTRMRQRALEADLVVVNHHLLCADLAVKDGSYGEVIPSYDTVILDEAHLLEDVATQYFGVQVSSHRVDDLVPRRGARAEGGEARRARGAAPRWTRCATARSACSSSCRWARAGASVPAGCRRAWPRSRARCSCGWRACAPRSWPSPSGRSRSPASPAARRRSRRRSAFVLAAEDDGHVYFVETRGRGVFLRATPIDVSARLRELLFDGCAPRSSPPPPSRWTAGSTTSRTRLGLEASEELLLPSPFDYERAGRPLRAPADAGARVPGLRGRGGGGDRAAPGEEPRPRFRALHLLREHERGGGADRGRVAFPLLIQGEAPKAALLETFRTTPGGGAPRHRLLLAGRGRGGGAALLRDHRQAALRLARRPRGGGADRPAAQPRAAIPSASTRCRWPCSC